MSRLQCMVITRTAGQPTSSNMAGTGEESTAAVRNSSSSTCSLEAASNSVGGHSPSSSTCHTITAQRPVALAVSSDGHGTGATDISTSKSKSTSTSTGTGSCATADVDQARPVAPLPLVKPRVRHRRQANMFVTSSEWRRSLDEGYSSGPSPGYELSPDGSPPFRTSPSPAFAFRGEETEACPVSPRRRDVRRRPCCVKFNSSVTVHQLATDGGSPDGDAPLSYKVPAQEYELRAVVRANEETKRWRRINGILTQAEERKQMAQLIITILTFLIIGLGILYLAPSKGSTRTL